MYKNQLKIKISKKITKSKEYKFTDKILNIACDITVDRYHKKD